MNETKSKIGVLLLNTGTPDSPEPKEIKAYLQEFLSDRNLIDVPPFIWNKILRFFILPKRPHITTERYKKIWMPEGSPFMVESLRQKEKLQRVLNSNTEARSKIIANTSNETNDSDRMNARSRQTYVVEYASRYGNPSVEYAFEQLSSANVSEVLTIPLFPQTAFSTTKTCIEKAEEVVAAYPHIKHRCIKGYSDHSQYHHAIAQSIFQWGHQPSSKVLFTFHSIPTKHIKDGDTYTKEIRASISAITRELGLAPTDWEIAFHSRFEDSRKWVGPNVYTVLQTWAQEHVERVAIIAPGFATDCLETLYDCEITQCDFYKKACADEGFTPNVSYIHSLNSSDLFIELLKDLVLEQYK